MATIDAQWVGPDETGVVYVTWEALGNADNGEAIAVAHLLNKSFQIIGNFGSATIVIEGSNDGGVTWNTLHDATGANCSYTAAAMGTAVEQPLLLRPRTSGGTGTDLDVILVLLAGIR